MVTKPTNAHYIIFIYQCIIDNLAQNLFVYIQDGDILYVNRSLHIIITNFKLLYVLQNMHF